MKYFIDTEFHEYGKQPKVLGLKVGKPIDTIDLISIGIVSEEIGEPLASMTDERRNNLIKSGKGIKHQNSREYYAICKEFDLKAAWDNEWLKENVLKSIHEELVNMNIQDAKRATRFMVGGVLLSEQFTYRKFKRLINKYGKTKKQIAEEVKKFVLLKEIGEDGRCKCTCADTCLNGKAGSADRCTTQELHKYLPEFYAYYADYDWVVFCWLFGRMIDLPKGFPMYCNDLKQDLDAYVNDKWLPGSISYMKGVNDNVTFDLALEKLKGLPEYPKQENEHNALADAKWNKELYSFINSL